MQKKQKIDLKSMLLGSALAAAVMLSVAAATTNRETDRSSATTTSNQKVTGIGGVFFKARDPKKMAAWYRDHLGIQSNGGFAIFNWREKDNPERMGLTTWALFSTNTTYLGSSAATMMINYRVANMERLLTQLRSDGVTVEKVKDDAFGRFAWIHDPEGNRIELWEPKAK